MTQRETYRDIATGHQFTRRPDDVVIVSTRQGIPIDMIRPGDPERASTDGQSLSAYARVWIGAHASD